MHTLKKLLVATLLSVLYLGVNALPLLPAQDKNVIKGKLKNGLTYYIRKNNLPENQVNFYIAQRVGSINENENQRGLAHFLEHMCFNGTENFPGNSLITYLEGNGVKFGADLNAYTSTDETVYNICNVPSGKKTLLDSCFLILKDWSNGLLLNGDDIDNERGVIKGEWRFRSGAYYRMLEGCAEKLYQGSKYGRRLPIGLMSVVENFNHNELRAYYKKWYHPSNQAIIVVGDIDVKYAENEIKRLFEPIQNPKKIAKVEKYSVPDNKKIISVVQTDKEQTSSSIQLLIKYNDIDSKLINTQTFYSDRLKKKVITSMLSERLFERTNNLNSPFTNAVAKDLKFMISKTKRALMIRAISKRDKECETVSAIENILRNATEYGFNETEYKRAKENYLSSLESLYKNRDKIDNKVYCKDYISNFLTDEPIPSIQDYYILMKQIISGMTLEDINSFYKQWVPTGDKNIVLVAFCPQSSEINVPTEQGLINAYHKAKNVKLSPYVDKVKAGPIMARIPESGDIIHEDSLPMFGAKTWTLSNGIKVFVKHTDFAPNSVSITATSPGGLSQFDINQENIASLKMINDVVAVSKVGNFTADELRKSLAGKSIKVKTTICNTEEGLSASSTPENLETAFQVIYLKTTAIQKDEEAYNRLLSSYRTKLETKDYTPKSIMGDTIFQTVYRHHPLSKKIEVDMLKNVDYDKILSMFNDRYKDMSDFTFVITGNYNEDSLRIYVKKYLASLPANGRSEEAKDIDYGFSKGHTNLNFSLPMENPQSVIYAFWNNNCELTQKNMICAEILGQITSTELRMIIREEKGWTYSINCRSSIASELNGDDGSFLLFPIYCPIKPGNEVEGLSIIKNTVKNLTKHIDDGYLNNAKQFLIKEANENKNDNSYWQYILRRYGKYNVDFHNDYIKTVESITDDDIQNFVKEYVITGNTCNIIMTPASK